MVRNVLFGRGWWLLSRRALLSAFSPLSFAWATALPVCGCSYEFSLNQSVPWGLRFLGIPRFLLLVFFEISDYWVLRSFFSDDVRDSRGLALEFFFFPCVH